MTDSDDISSIKDRLAKARGDCDVWRASGRGEKYLEAYFLLQALELQLDLEQQRMQQDAAPALSGAGVA
jgi:hypothetical protein